MHVYQGVYELNPTLAASVVTIGNFDGVHLGHQQLIENVVREAEYFGVPSVVYTFNPHPALVLHPERASGRLFNLLDQQEQFALRGLDYVIMEPFTKSFSQVSAEDFLDAYINRNLKPKTLVVGHDFSFGADRAGNLNFLEHYCSGHGIRLIIIPPFRHRGVLVSSSSIRERLKNGQVEEANELLGRTYYLRGQVEKGFQRGRSIGVPTANIHPEVEFMPRSGVYCTLMKLGSQLYPSVTNIGFNPTFEGEEQKIIKVETHLFDFDAQIYGADAQVYLLHFIRDEIKFSGLRELQYQINQDIVKARRYFHENPQHC